MSEIRNLISRLLVSEGALIEPIDPDGLEVLTTPSLQEMLEVDEFIRLGFGAELPKDAIRVSLESEWLDKLGLLVKNRGHVLNVVLDEKNTRWPSSPDRLVDRKMVLENATYRFIDAGEARTHYLLLVFHATAISDEKREDMFSVCLNESNSAYADHLIPGLFDYLQQTRPEETLPSSAAEEAGTPWSASQARECCSHLLRARIRGRLAPFLTGMERRMSRDLERLLSYHTDLRNEAALQWEKKKEKDAASLKCEKMRIEAIEQEYRAKIEDLKRRYAMRVDVRLIQAVRVTLPVYRLQLRILRRKGHRAFHLDWNPLSKQLDDLPCESCGMPAKTHYVCDERLHLLCPVCMTVCPGCQKTYCRACHRQKCPKCGRKDVRLAGSEPG